MSSSRKGGIGLLLALGICLPCLVPLLVIAVLAGGGVGAIGSFFSDNALLVLAIAAGVAVCALAMGMTVRWAMYGTAGIRFLSKND